MKINAYQNIYFVGIGGIGMSALARYFLGRGKNVAGYDKTPTALTETLQKEGISIHFQAGINQIDAAFKNIEKTLVIYTPAISTENEELAYFLENGFQVLKRARVLAEIANAGYSIAVGGTHGKTTTSSLIAHIFNQHKKEVSAFLGGISKNIESNFVHGSSNTIVLEADEFDRSFHQLSPDIALITAMDADHLDIYGSEAAIVEAFTGFAERVKPNGALIHKYGLPLSGITYGLVPQADFFADDISVQDGKFHFTLHAPNDQQITLTTGLPGRHNIENAVGAAAVCYTYGLDLQTISSGIATFGGVVRRFDVRVKTESHVYIDDYAHHPEEIRAFLQAVRELYPNKKVTAVFQPHLYSRTRDFADGFAQALLSADELILLPIYPAREAPIAGITTEWLASKINAKAAKVLDAHHALKYLEEKMPELVVTIGAGDIDKLVKPLTQILSK